MDDQMARLFLKIPLFRLLSLKDPEHYPGMPVNEVEAFRKEYERHEQENIIAAIKWALDNPEFELTSILPGLPGNQQIREYLEKINISLSS